MASPSARVSLGAKLIRWSRRQARNLPWRCALDPAPSRTGHTAGAPEPGGAGPYRIWISEIMLQQTRVETVIPYYRSFLKRFPRVKSLARSDRQSVLRVWEGLGYYSRARNLHRAAREIVSSFNGRFPRSAADWERLPGVGRYTAAAIASLAYNERAIALDANAKRILARIYAYQRALRGTRAERDLAVRFQSARGASAPGKFFQAMMDLGQLVCLPRQPLCSECPIASHCESKRLGIQNRLPLRPKPARIPHYDVTAAVILRSDKVLLARRPEGKILGGMWEFPGGKRERGESLPACLRRELREELGVSVRVLEPIAVVQHAFTHFRITLHVFRCDSMRGRPRPIDGAAVRWVRIVRLRLFPMGRADRIVAGRIADR
jgi:A/G-specific adenine glycosylase